MTPADYKKRIQMGDQGDAKVPLRTTVADSVTNVFGGRSVERLWIEVKEGLGMRNDDQGG